MAAWLCCRLLSCKSRVVNAVFRQWVHNSTTVCNYLCSGDAEHSYFRLRVFDTVWYDSLLQHWKSEYENFIFLVIYRPEFADIWSYNRRLLKWVAYVWIGWDKKYVRLGLCYYYFLNYLSLKYSIDSAKLFFILKLFIALILGQFFVYYTNKCTTSYSYK